MKELSIEEKAKANDGNYKAYTELISRLEDVKNAIKKQNYGIAMDILYKPYPDFQVTTHSELKESEDEKIRKAIKKTLQVKCDGSRIISDEPVTLEEAIAWIEKQGKNNMGISEATKQKLEDNLNNALEKETPESWNKFLDEQGEQKPAKVEPKFKVGDIISNGISEAKIVSIDKTYYNVTNDEIENDANVCNWVVYFKNQDDWKLVEQKPAWSEEDERVVESILKYYKYMREEWVNWLKSLKDRYTWKPSDEQMDALYTYIYNPQYFSSPDPRMELVESVYKDLKKLKEK